MDSSAEDRVPPISDGGLPSDFLLAFVHHLKRHGRAAAAAEGAVENNGGTAGNGGTSVMVRREALAVAERLLRDLTSPSSSSSASPSADPTSSISLMSTTTSPHSQSPHDGNIFLGSITGSAKWDVFVIYICFCVLFIACCCLSVVAMFWCCPARSADVVGAGGRGRGGGGGGNGEGREGGRDGGEGGAGIYVGGSPSRVMMRQSSSLRQFSDDEDEDFPDQDTPMYSAGVGGGGGDKV